MSRAAIKVLVPSTIAPYVVGSKGSGITEIVGGTSTRVEMSRKHELFPGTQEQVCVLSGSPEDVLDCVPRLCERLAGVGLPEPAGANHLVTLIAPHSVCSALIGRAGSTIQSIQQETRCKARVEEHSSEELPVTVKGDARDVANAVYRFCEILCDSRNADACVSIAT